MESRTYVFAGGGTGGHLFPGLAVARALQQLDPRAAIVFMTTSRELDGRLLAGTGYERVSQNVRPFTLHPARIVPFWLAWRRSVAAADRLLRGRRASAVLGLGGYAAGPAVVAATRLGISAAILNPDAVPGRANRYLASRADLVVLQWGASRRHFGRRVRCEVLGCPIRAEFREHDAAAGRRHFGLDPARPVVLVTGASQGARSVNETMTLVWPTMRAEHPEWQILHLTGEADEVGVRQAYERAGARAVVLSFTKDMPLALSAADLVVSRAGASTLAELTALGKPSVLLPYPYHRDRHQHRNADVLVEAGAALLVEDHRAGAANAAGFRAALDQVLRPDVRSRMSAAALTLSRPDAATAVARWMYER